MYHFVVLVNMDIFPWGSIYSLCEQPLLFKMTRGKSRIGWRDQELSFGWARQAMPSNTQVQLLTGKVDIQRDWSSGEKSHLEK